MRLDQLDIPDGVSEILAEQGIEELYPPQERSVPLALSGNNLVVAVPTASGKSLIAYLAALKHVLDRGGKVLYIVPLKALASEKVEDLEMFRPLGVRTAISVGEYDTPDPRLEDFDIIVATSEKADSLLRHRSGWLSSISLVVADEIHLIHDPGRGPTLEVTLAKFRKFNPSLQIIALSATIKNAADLAEWLQADLVADDWRPVTLKEGVYLEGTIHFTDNTFREIECIDDPVWSLIRDVVQEGGQCLVFVNTRRSTESLASKYAARMKKLIGGGMGEAEDLDEETTMARKLKFCVRKGIAFHNAGLTTEQRRGVERAFKKGDIKCIVATPTLAAGINLPARRVVIRDVYRYEGGYGYSSIPVLEIKQMCGRAGRPRYDPWGEAVLLAKDEGEKKFLMENYLLNETEEIFSKLGSEPVMRSHVLATVATGTVSSRESLLDFLGTTFFAYQTELYHLESSMENVLDFLQKEEMIFGKRELRATFFGKRVSDLYIDPLSAVQLRDALRKIRGSNHSLGVLHAICSTPDMLSMYLRRNDYDRMEEILLTRGEELLLPIPDDLTEYEFYLSDLKTALLLEDWIEEMDEDDMLKQYGIGPGDLRNKVETADWLLYSMREMANIFNKDAYPEITEIITRVKYGVKKELLELTSLRGIGRARARSLFDRGLRSAADLRKVDVRTISRIPGIGEALAIHIKEQVGGVLETNVDSERESEEDTSQGGQLRLDDF
ncbi:MAG TPA: DEAD/DEAH box helicase [Methanomassiliicoccales archaeon]|nr:DEAD/DEAH box helicase [Methanomassiliicoccales archaeon]